MLWEEKRFTIKKRSVWKREVWTIREKERNICNKRTKSACEQCRRQKKLHSIVRSRKETRMRIEEKGEFKEKKKVKIKGISCWVSASREKE